MPPKKSNLNNASTKGARRRRVARAQQLLMSSDNGPDSTVSSENASSDKSPRMTRRRNIKPKDYSDYILDSTTSSSEPRAAISNGKGKGRKRKSTSTTDIHENVSQSTGNEDDEFAVFAKYIATELRQLPFHNALQCQEKIETVVEEERLFVESRQAEIDAVLIKQEPEEGEEEIESVLIKEEPKIMDDDFVDSQSQQQAIESVVIKQEPIISDEVGNETSIEAVINDKPSENDITKTEKISDSEL